jgi:hypothetical protein
MGRRLRLKKEVIGTRESESHLRQPSDRKNLLVKNTAICAAI